VGGAAPAELGAWLREALDAWTPELPLTDAWGALPADRLAAELATCEQGLLQTEAAVARLRERLVRRFPDVTAIRALAPVGTGGTR
jgi:hypothetical protein